MELSRPTPEVPTRPDVERRLLESLHQSSGRVLELADVRRHRRQEVLCLAKAGTDHDQFAEVGRQPLGDPEAARARRLFIVERTELDRDAAA